MINGLLGVFSVRVLPKGTAFVTDVGMPGSVNLVIGSDVGAAVERCLTGMPKRLAVADGPSIMNSVLIDVSDDGTATSIERVDREVDLDGS